MIFEESYIKGVFKITPRVFSDHRGIFFESFNHNVLSEHVPDTEFVQDNHSFSYKGVLRGLHFQKKPHSQGKLVRVLKGKVLDVVVDMDPESPTFGKHDKFILDAEKHEMVYLPDTMAHGFLALEDTIFTYKCTRHYDHSSESGIIWNDPDLQIDWGTDQPILSEKDEILPHFAQIN